MLRRLKPFDVHLHYTDRHRLPPEVEQELGVTWHETAADMVPHCDVVTINCPLHPETENLFDAAMIARMKRGAYLVNTARGKIANRDAVADALESGQLAGYAGDVWFPQPAPRSHPCPMASPISRAASSGSVPSPFQIARFLKLARLAAISRPGV